MRLWITALMLAVPLPLAYAQQPTVRSPDCQVGFVITATGSSFSFDNRTAGCDTWTLSYAAYNASAVSINMRSAPDNNGSPGSWSTFGSTLTSTAYGETSQSNYVPWLGVTGTFTFSAGGFVKGLVVGWRPGPVATP